jgi:D-alanyl-D-alanine carboxypeptidase/D-alanyl-D-alanine-endopeptidase (penicillin-binding protein 4)
MVEFTMMPVKLLYSLLLLFSLAPCAHAASLPPSVLTALRQAHIPLADIGVEVREANSRKPLISVNSARPMNPASTMKLLTTYAGLEVLGPAYIWKTEAWLDGKLENGELHGDLILKGYGDPKLTIEQFWLWLRELRGRGLRKIHGNVILDRSAFQLAPHDPAAFDNDPVRAYNVGPDALLLNFNAIRLHIIPHGEKVGIFVEPELAGITLDNRLTMVAQGDCANWDDAVFPQLNGATLLIQGTFPASCGERAEYVSLLPHSNYLNAVFRALWQELGGTLSGGMRDGVVPDGATLFASHNSAPLSELIRDINKFSNNVMARQLFLSLGISSTTPTSIARSEQVVHDWLAQKKLNFPELVLENGAGLSRVERISPHSMALLLQDAQHGPLQPEFEASLPIVGVDGTLKKRLHENAAASHAHLKTGSLEGVKTIAGYVQSRDGKQWIMVFFINHPNASAGQRAQDALIEWVQQR